jgi:hypothetical protein
MDYEYLAQAAYGRYDLVKYSKKRRNLVVKIRHHHEIKTSNCQTFDCAQTTLHTFDLQCLTESEKQFFTNRMISYEREVFPDDFVGSDGGQKHESLLRTMALDKMEDDKYCMIDVDKTLADPWWDDFFTTLEQGK